MTLMDIATQLGVSKSSVSLWTQDVDFIRMSRRPSVNRRPSSLQLRKYLEIEELREEGRQRVGTLGDREFLVAGLALYAGEGSKGDGAVTFANCDPRMIAFFVTWLRRFFPIDESRLRMSVYLHEGLDLDATKEYWSELARIPLDQFRTGYRAPADPTMRRNKHEHGCAYVKYYCSRTHRTIMGLIEALLSSRSYIPG